MIEDYLKEIFSKTRDSKHCKGKKEKVDGYDHTGYIRYICDCGRNSEWEKI